MIQHKFYVKYNGDWSIFDKMKKEREYETFSKKDVGGIYIGMENKRKFFSIASQHGIKYQGYYDQTNRKFVHSKLSKIMYEISKEEFENIYTKIVEEAL
jgi:hypothetical protein